MKKTPPAETPAKIVTMESALTEYKEGRAAADAANTAAIAKVTSKMPVAVTGTWDGARKWRDAAVAMEQGKLFCQVHLGFELIAIRASLPNESGKRTDLTSSQAGTRWEEALDKELGLSRTTAYRLIEMAEAAKSRLKSLPELREFDPSTTAVSKLPEKTQEALTKAVKKLTDGTTQSAFMQELGLAKKPQGAGATGRDKGEGGPGKKLSPSEQAELLKELAVEDWKHLGNLHVGYATKFTLVSDPEVEAQIAVLEQALKARKTWINTPTDKRDVNAIAALLGL